MNALLKAEIYRAIDRAIARNSEAGLWEGYVHPGLVGQMADAAGIVFDSAMESQVFVEAETTQGVDK